MTEKMHPFRRLEIVTGRRFRQIFKFLRLPGFCAPYEGVDAVEEDQTIIGTGSHAVAVHALRLVEAEKLINSSASLHPVLEHRVTAGGIDAFGRPGTVARSCLSLIHDQLVLIVTDRRFV